MSAGMGLYAPSKISRFDLYRSSPKDLTEPTSIGGFVSIIALAVMSYLIATELWAHLTPSLTTTMLVTNASERFDRVRVNFNVTMHALPCVVASVDHQDVMGGHTMDIHGSIVKTRLSATGDEIGVYIPHEERGDDHGHGDAHGSGGHGAPHGHSHGHPQVTPEEAAVLAAEANQQKGEGCRLHGSFTVKKVPGNVHISAHAHANLLSRIYGNRPMDVSHSIHSFWFGDTEAGAATRSNVPQAQLDPLHGTEARLPVPVATGTGKGGSRPEPPYSQEYFLEVVPTKFVEQSGRAHHSHQFAAHQTSVQGRYPIPAVYFRFNFSPLTVTYEAVAKPWSHFVVQLCAIVGGVFVVLGLVSSSLNTAHKAILDRKRA